MDVTAPPGSHLTPSFERIDERTGRPIGVLSTLDSPAPLAWGRA